MAKKAITEVESEIMQELRSILRLRTQLACPLSAFTHVLDRPIGSPPFYVAFDTSPPATVDGLKASMLFLSLPDERIIDSTLELAKAIWHLKDRLRRWFGMTRSIVDVEAHGQQSKDLLVCADLANAKKHGENTNRSDLNPKLDGVVKFDLSKSGIIELYYNGAAKSKVLYVSNPIPISFSVTVKTGAGVEYANAVELMTRAILHWWILIKPTSILSIENPEGAVIIDAITALR